MPRSNPATSARSTNTMAEGFQPTAAAAPLSKAQLKQHEATLAGLAFLHSITSISVTGSTYYSEREYLLFDVIVKDHEAHAQALGSEKKIAEEALKIQPTVNYSNMKGLSTLHHVHAAVREWSSKPHQSPGFEPAHCAYCSQFNSPAALELWDFQGHNVHDKEARAALVVTDARTVLKKIEKCLNNYLESARNVPAQGPKESDCEGYAHIPSMVASFLQNESYNSRAIDLAALSCQIM